MAGCGSDDKPSKSGPECGNGKIDTLADGAAAEECDGTDFGGADCKSAKMNMSSTGTLKCTATCTLDTSGCSAGTATGGTGGAGGSGGTVVMGGMGGMVMGGMGGMNDASSTGGSSTGGSSTGGSSTGDASVDASTDGATEGGNGRGQP